MGKQADGYDGDFIEPTKLRLDGGTQSRAGLDEATVAEYTQTLIEDPDVRFPPVKVVFDGKNYWLVDGFHRIEAAKRANRSYFWAEIIQGTQRDAVLMSTGVNASHGLRRTNADKRRAVETLLRDPEWKQWADREIARRTLTSNRFVGNVRDELAAATPQPSTDGPVNESQSTGGTRTVQRGGKTFEMKVGSIGADKRGGQGADTWALIERGAWKFMNGYYYAIDQKAKVIYFLDLQRGYKPINAITCEVFFPGCIAVQGASLNSDWQQYRAAGYTFKSPDEFPRKQPPPTPPDTELHPPGHSRNPIQPAGQNPPSNEQFLGLDDHSYFIVDESNKVVWDTPMDWQHVSKECQRLNKKVPAAFGVQAGHVLKKVAKYDRYRLTTGNYDAENSTEQTTPWYEQSKFRVGMLAICRKCKVQGDWIPHPNWEPTEANKLWRCKKCGAQTADSLMKALPPESQPKGTVPATNGLTGEAITKHRQLRGLIHFRMLNNYSRDAGRALQKINFEHGFEAASVAAKGMVSIYNKGAERLMKAQEEWGALLEQTAQKKKGK